MIGALKRDPRPGLILPQERHRNYLRVVTWACFTLMAAFHLWSLMRMPPPFVDEAWFASRAWEMLQSGRAVSSLDLGVVDSYDGYWTAFPWLLPAIQSVSLRVLGLSLFAARITSLFFGFLLLVEIYWITRNLSNPLAGTLAVAIAGWSMPFVASAHLARPDILVAVFGYAAIGLYLSQENSTVSWRAFLSGLLISLAFDFHMNAAIFGVALCLLYLLDHGWRLVLRGSFWSMLFGATVGLVIYGAVHVVPYPATYFAIMAPDVTVWRPAPVLSGNPKLLVDSVLDQLLQLAGYGFGGFFQALVMGAFAWRMCASLQSHVKLFRVVIAMTVSMSALVLYKSGLYAILITPSLAMLAGSLVSRGIDQTRRGDAWAGRACAGALGITAAALIISAQIAMRDPSPDYQRVLNSLQAQVPKGSTIIGSQTYWFALPEERYLSMEMLSYYVRYNPGSSIQDALVAFRPDYLVLDRHHSANIADRVEDLPESLRYLFIPKAELDEFIGRQAILVEEITTTTFGTISIYRVKWE